MDQIWIRSLNWSQSSVILGLSFETGRNIGPKHSVHVAGFINKCCLYRYPTKPLDLIWYFEDRNGWSAFSTSKKVTNKNGALEPSLTVMMTAVRPVNNSDALYCSWLAYDSATQFPVYLHFAELELLGHDMMGRFTVCMLRWLMLVCYDEPVRPEYHHPDPTTIEWPR